jgi:hypothetical protein
MNVFWFFFTKKDRLLVCVAAASQQDSASFCKMKQKLFGRNRAKTASHRRNRLCRVPDRMRYAPQGEIGA